MSQSQCGSHNPQTVGFLTLPRELRDKIYTELLHVDRVYDLHSNAYHFQSAILQTNKQIYEEGSQMLYEENSWVMFTVRISNTWYECNHRPSSHFLISNWEDRFEYLRCRAKLHVDITQPIADPETVQALFLVPHIELLQAVANLTRRRSTAKSEYTFRLNIPRHTPNEQRSAEQEALLDAFLDVRGVAKSVIEGAEPASLGKEVAQTMMTPITHLREVASRMQVYLARANKKIAEHHFIDACRICMYAMMHIVFMLCRPDLSDFKDFTDQHTRAVLEQTKGDLISGLALCCVELGVTQPARRMLEEVFRKSSIATLEQSRCPRRIYFQIHRIHGVSVTFRFGHILSINPDCEIFNPTNEKLKMGFELAGINGLFTVSRFPRVRVRDLNPQLGGSEGESEADITPNILYDYRFGKKLFKPLLARYQS